MKYKYYIGIDPGVKTGLAVWGVNERQLIQVQTLTIHEALQKVFNWRDIGIKVRFEDARQRKWFGKAGREQLQGAGSIKRDCKIWDDFLKSLNMDFEMVPPKNNKTKQDAETFRRLTGYTGTTSEHGRDAAMLVFGF